MVTDLAALEVLSTAANGILTTIDADTGSIDSKITACNTGAVVVASGAITETNSGAIATDVAALEVLSTAANALLTTISSHTTLSNWTSTNLMSVEAIAGGAITTSTAVDLGDSLHVPRDITVYINNSAQVASSITPQSSTDGSTWYICTASKVFSAGRAIYFSLVNDLATPVGRYLRFSIANTSGSSSNYSVKVGRYD